MSIKALDRLKLPEGMRIPYFGGVLYRTVSKLEQQYVAKLPVDTLHLNTQPREKKIIVSLTSFPARIDTVGYAIKCLFNQTMRPDRIVLFLSREQFPAGTLPPLLEQLQRRGLEIQFRPGDLRSHKKYFYILQEQKEHELVITYDDDLIYPENSIERLYKTYLKYPHCIITNRASCMMIQDGSPVPYRRWKLLSDAGVKLPSASLFPSTGGGVLYPYGTVNAQAFCEEALREYAFTADDLWMRFMSALNRTYIVKTGKYHKTFTVVPGSQEESLQIYNCLEGGNDKAIAALTKAYPQALAFLAEEC